MGDSREEPAGTPQQRTGHVERERACRVATLKGDFAQLASGAGCPCVYRTMNTLNICEPGEPKATCWLRRGVIGLLGLVALLSLVASFAVEVMATGGDLHGRAQGPLGATQALSEPDLHASIDQPLKPTN